MENTMEATMSMSDMRDIGKIAYQQGRTDEERRNRLKVKNYEKKIAEAKDAATASRKKASDAKKAFEMIRTAAAEKEARIARRMKEHGISAEAIAEVLEKDIRKVEDMLRDDFSEPASALQ